MVQLVPYQAMTARISSAEHDAPPIVTLLTEHCITVVLSASVESSFSVVKKGL